MAVKFGGSASSEPAGSCGTINSYTLDFGDGSAPVTQITPTFAHTYNNSGDYPARLTVIDTAGQTSTNPAQVVITVSPARTPDLIVPNLTAANNQAPQGSKIPITATIRNQGNGNARASYTSFKLDGKTSIGQLSTLAINAGASTSVTLNWNTAGVSKGNHTITATADVTNLVKESDETNNTSIPITIYIQGNKTR